MAVRTGAGVFDVSHMGQVITSGPDAAAFLQHLLSNDVTKIADGGAQYSVLLLDGSPASDPRVPGRYRYVGPEYSGRNSATCQREVIVDYERNEQELQEGVPSSAGIITSFGRRIG